MSGTPDGPPPTDHAAVVAGGGPCRQGIAKARHGPDAPQIDPRHAAPGSRKPADIVASDGDDSADGGGLADWIDGGEGNDLLRGWDGADTLAGGLGHDTLGGGAGDDRLALGAGHDLGLGGAGEDSLSGEAGENRLFGGDGMDSLDGGDDRDTLDGGAGGDVLAGGAGDDLLRGGGGGDLLDGGDGVDLAGYRNAIGGVGVDLGAGTAWGEAAGDGFAAIEGLISSAHSDTLSGDDGGNRLVGLGGGDLLYGVGGDDTLCGGEGGDVLHGGVGDDLLAGGAGDDTLLDGGAGSDRLWGGEGDDLLVHRPGAEVPGARDTLGGGLGHDTLRLHLAPGALDDAALRADLEAQAAVLAGPAAGQQRDFAYQAIALQTHSIEHLQLVLDGTLITLGGTTLRLVGVAAGLTEADFLFA